MNLKFNIIKIGALTSKPYAFTARSWELESIDSVDFFDSMCSSLRVDSRGFNIMRILPRTNELLNEEWISDKIRFSYDAVKYQRILSPMLNENGNLKNVSWNSAFRFIEKKFIKSKTEFNAVLGDYVDYCSLYSLKQMLMKTTGLTSFSFNSDLTNVNSDLRQNYLFNSTYVNIQSADFLFLAGCNPRYEAPILNLYIHRQVKQNHLTVVQWGFFSQLNYKNYNLGGKVSDFLKFFEGRHFLSTHFIKAAAPLVLTGVSLMQRRDSLSFSRIFNTFTVVKRLALNNINFNVKISTLLQNSTRIGVFELGLTSFLGNSCDNLIKKKDFGVKNFIYFLTGSYKDEALINSLKKSNFLVYQGFSGFDLLNKFDVVLPGCFPFEKESLVLNGEGSLLPLSFIVKPPKEVRTDWMVLQSLLIYLGYRDLKYFESSIVLSKYLKHPMSGDLKKASTFYSNLNLSKENLFYNSVMSFMNVEFGSFIHDYYIFDSIGQNSKIMALASRRFKQQNISNFRSVL